MKSKILQFTIQIYDSIYEILPTIQSRIPILTIMPIYDCMSQFCISLCKFVQSFNVPCLVYPSKCPTIPM